ncbi:hypothetical protein JCM10213_005719 [Rhodosporidiobolus nylandii]
MAADNPLTPLLDALQQAIVPPTHAAANLPAAADLAFERTLSRRLAKNLDAEADRILTLASRVLNWASPAAKDDLDADLVREGVYNPVVQRIEQLLERADDAVDKHLGQGKHRKAAVGAVGAKSAQELAQRDAEKAKRERLPARLLHDASLEKPQNRFTSRTALPRPSVDDGSANGAEGIPLWKPLLRRKVNALGGEDSEGWLRTEVFEPTSSFTVTTNTSPPAYTRYAHPYADELAALKPPASFFEKPNKPEPHPKNSFDKVPFEWVADAKALEKMVGEIRQCGEEGAKDLAIDLEHHDFRTWGGITCLIQLSTRKKDYVIDALDPAVRDNLDQLNEFFTDPEWVKVFHGANSDIVWLQRDFGLYIVGLFDTYHATKVLGYSQHSLASLLDMYTDFEADKRYQLADWRIRPLPKEMMHYARSDTHYLLSIYDHLRLALHAKGASQPSSSDPTPLADVYTRSISVSRITFSLPPFDHETGHFDAGFLAPLAKHGQLKSYATVVAVPTLPIKTGWGPGEGKFEVLRAVVRWREQTAREEDESPRFVLSLGGTWQLAELGGIGRVREGRDVMQILGGARGGVSEVVRRRKEELAELVVQALEGATGRKLAAPGEEGEDVEMAPAAPAQLGLPVEEPSVQPLTGLWDDAGAVEPAPVASTSASAVQVATGSSFFGASSSTASVPAASPSVSVATSSSFFGGASKPSTSASAKAKGKRAASSLPSPAERAASRRAAVERVHASLVLGGGLAASLQAHVIPSASPAAPAPEVDLDTPLEPVDAAAQPEALAPSADHTYVPLSGRIPKEEKPSLLPADSRAPKLEQPKAKDSDVIVVSNMKDKGKKRKRVVQPAAPAAEDAVESPASPPPAPAPKKAKTKKLSRAELAASVVPHDYSTSGSILDAGPVKAAGNERRQADKAARKKEEKEDRKKKESGRADNAIDTTAFGRAPRVNNAPKSAARAQSFAK